jgi:NAD(P)-dependent dehydrogenase (short-subunit alcohol dehydrogenase family)
VLVTGAGSGIGRAVAQVLARAGHCIYASMRLHGEHGSAQAEDARQFAVRERLDLRVVEMDVLSEASCRAAIDQVLGEQGRIDAVVNNAGMLMVGVTEAFAPEQLAQIFDTNAIFWLCVNRAVLPAMRRQGRGVLVYVSSTTAPIFEPFSDRRGSWWTRSGRASRTWSRCPGTSRRRSWDSLGSANS